MVLTDRARTAALLGAAVLLALGVPVRVWAQLPDLCLFHRCTGLPCPGCGLTRSWAALLHGQVGAAFHYHWFGPPLLVGLLLACAAQCLPKPPAAPSRGWLLGLAVVWLGYGLARMAGLGWVAY